MDLTIKQKLNIAENAIKTSQKFCLDDMVQAYIKIIQEETLKITNF